MSSVTGVSGLGVVTVVVEDVVVSVVEDEVVSWTGSSVLGPGVSVSAAQTDQGAAW